MYNSYKMNVDSILRILSTVEIGSVRVALIAIKSKLKKLHWRKRPTLDVLVPFRLKVRLFPWSLKILLVHIYIK